MKYFQRYPWIVIVSCLLAACNVSMSPSDQVKTLNPLPSMEKDTKHRLHHSSVFKTGRWPSKRWWLVYHSPELNALMRNALSCNPSLLEARQRINVAKQETIVARSLLFPLVYFTPTNPNLSLSEHGLYKALNPALPRGVYLVDVPLTFNYEFDFWGKYHHLFYAAIGKEKTAEAEADQVRLIISTALAQAYFAYQTNLLRKTYYQQLLDVRQRLWALNRLLLNKGLVSALVPYASGERVEDTKKWLESINEEIAVDQHLVNVLAGRGPETPLPGLTTLPLLPKRLTIPKTLSIDLIARRPDLMAQIWRAKTWAEKAGAAKADFYPNVNLVGFLGLQSVSWKSLLAASSIEAGLTPAMSLPIFTAGAIRANVNIKQAEFYAAIQAYNQLLLSSTQEVLDVLATGQSVYRQKRDQEQSVQFAKKRYQLAKLRERKGLDNALTTYVIEEELIEKQLDNIRLLFSQYAVSVKLTKALGGGYCQPGLPLVNPSFASKMVAARSVKSE